MAIHGQKEKINILMTSEQREKVETTAKDMGISRNELLMLALEEYFTKSATKKIQKIRRILSI